MRSTRLLALAALVALPFTATVAGAAPATPNAGNALSQIDARGLVVDVRKNGGGHRGGMRGHRSGGFKGYRGGGRHFAGRRHWRGGYGHRHHHHFRPRFYPGWYGVPYYYNYGPTYYQDYYDDGYDDYDDDAVVYAQDGDAVARCEARYRSFDRGSGTFLSNDGRRKLCPYLK